MSAFLLLALMASPEPLAASDQWILQYGEDSCTLSRSFGEADRGVMLAFRTIVAGSFVDLNLLTHGSGTEERRGEARIAVSRIEGDIVGTFVSFLGGGGHRVIKVPIESGALTGWPDAATVGVSADGQEMVFALTGMERAFDALDTCRQHLLTAWSIDPADLAAIATPASPIDPDSNLLWITSADYPVDAIRAGAQGVTNILWTIDTDGRVRDCRITQSSGHASLDQAACDAIKKRGHYRPALDHDGNPVKSWTSRSVSWALPTG